MQITTISHTAWLVMMCQLALYHDPRWRSLVRDDDAVFYRACSDYCRHQSFIHNLTSLIPYKPHRWLVEQALAKGAPQHFVLRKQAIRKQTEECIKQGITQIVVFGGGFDPLALEMARNNPELRCFEFDMPTMHFHKVNIARNHYGALPENFYGMGEDLSRRSVRTILSLHPMFDSSKPTLFIAEGVTMYLTAEAVEQLFADMRALCATPHFIFTAVESFKHARDGWGSKLRQMTMHLSGEAFYWSMARMDMLGFLLKQKFAQQYLLSYDDFQRPWRTDEEIAVIEKQNGEYLVYAIAA